MRSRLSHWALIVVFVLTGVLVASSAGAQRRFGGTYVATLNGAQMVPAVNTLATGSARFDVILTASGAPHSILFTLTVNSIEDVAMAHIHAATIPGQPFGPAVIWHVPVELEHADVIPGPFPNQVLAAGLITAANLTGPFTGLTIPRLVAEMRANRAAVVVHTRLNPHGEIRGQIRLSAAPVP